MTAQARPPAYSNRMRVTRLGDLTSPELTGRFGVHWTDLGIPVRCPDGRVLYVFGDTFGPEWGQNWRSPVGLWSTTELPDRVTFSGAPGGDFAKQLIPYAHDENISTIIPTDAITIGDTIYLAGCVNRGFANVIWSGIWTSTDNGETWNDSGARFPAEAYQEMWQLFSWDIGADGWLYVYSAEFLRESPMILHRVRPEDITSPEKYEPWGLDGDTWRWGAAPTPVVDDIIGEMSLRRFGEQWVLTWFDRDHYRIDAMVLDHPTQDLRATERVTLLYGTDWDTQDTTHVAQLYGSFVIPGSTLDDLHLTVSQWNTADNSRYNVMHYRFQGLERRQLNR